MSSGGEKKGTSPSRSVSNRGASLNPPAPGNRFAGHNPSHSDSHGLRNGRGRTQGFQRQPHNNNPRIRPREPPSLPPRFSQLRRQSEGHSLGGTMNIPQNAQSEFTGRTVPLPVSYPSTPGSDSVSSESASMNQSGEDTGPEGESNAYRKLMNGSHFDEFRNMQMGAQANLNYGGNSNQRARHVQSNRSSKMNPDYDHQQQPQQFNINDFSWPTLPTLQSEGTAGTVQTPVPDNGPQEQEQMPQPEPDNNANSYANGIQQDGRHTFQYENGSGFHNYNGADFNHHHQLSSQESSPLNQNMQGNLHHNPVNGSPIINNGHLQEMAAPPIYNSPSTSQYSGQQAPQLLFPTGGRVYHHYNMSDMGAASLEAQRVDLSHLQQQHQQFEVAPADMGAASLEAQRVDLSHVQQQRQQFEAAPADLGAASLEAQRMHNIAQLQQQHQPFQVAPADLGAASLEAQRFDLSQQQQQYHQYQPAPAIQFARQPFIDTARLGLQRFHEDCGPGVDINQRIELPGGNYPNTRFEVDRHDFVDPRPIVNLVPPGEREYKLFDDPTPVSRVFKSIYDMNKHDFMNPKEICGEKMLPENLANMPISMAGSSWVCARRRVVNYQHRLYESINTLSRRVRNEDLQGRDFRQGEAGTFGMRSLTRTIATLQQSGPAPTSTVLSVGMNVNKIIKNLDSSMPLTPQFPGPLSDRNYLLSLGSMEVVRGYPEYQMPNHIGNHEIGRVAVEPIEWMFQNRLTRHKIRQFDNDLLFYIFYTFPHETLQVFVSGLLYEKGYRFHTIYGLWITPDWGFPGIYNVTNNADAFESGFYRVFMHQEWKFERVYLKIMPHVLAPEPPKVPLHLWPPLF